MNQPVQVASVAGGWRGVAVATLVGSLLLSTAAGCGSRETAQVSGRVQYKGGGQLDGAVRIIRFEPTSDSTATVRKAASGEIREDGSFELFTRKPGDGVYLGEYAVTFTVLTRAMGGQSLIKEEYTSGTTTPYVVEVTGNMNDLLYEVEPRGG